MSALESERAELLALAAIIDEADVVILREYRMLNKFDHINRDVEIDRKEQDAIVDALRLAAAPPQPTPVEQAGEVVKPIGYVYQPQGAAADAWAYSHGKRPDLNQGVYWTVQPVFTTPQPAPSFAEGFEACREALVLAEDVLSRAPFSTAIWPNGMHPNTGIMKIRAAIASLSAPSPVRGDEPTIGGTAFCGHGVMAAICEICKHPDTANESAEALCDDCPPVGYETDRTRCLPCPRRAGGDEATKSDGSICCYCDHALSCAHCGREQPSDPPAPRREIAVDDEAVAWRWRHPSWAPAMWNYVTGKPFDPDPVLVLEPLYTRPAKAVDVEAVARTLAYEEWPLATIEERQRWSDKHCKKWLRAASAVKSLLREQGRGKVSHD